MVPCYLCKFIQLQSFLHFPKWMFVYRNENCEFSIMLSWTVPLCPHIKICWYNYQYIASKTAYCTSVEQLTLVKKILTVISAISTTKRTQGLDRDGQKKVQLQVEKQNVVNAGMLCWWLSATVDKASRFGHDLPASGHTHFCCLRFQLLRACTNCESIDKQKCARTHTHKIWWNVNLAFLRKTCCEF